MNEPVKTGFLASIGVVGGLAFAGIAVLGVMFLGMCVLCGGCMLIGSAPSLQKQIQKSNAEVEQRMEEIRQQELSASTQETPPAVPSSDATGLPASEPLPPTDPPATP